MPRDRLKQLKRVAPSLGSVSRLWTSDQRSSTEGSDGPKKFTEGVPLVKLIKRKMTAEAELVMLSKAPSVAAEKIRRLKTILANAKDGGPQVLVVTSAGPGDGKTLIAVNLALAFAAEAGEDVLLVDADLRRPSINRWILPPPSLGLSELLSDQTELEHTILELENSRLRILPAGAPPRDPIELLGSSRARDLISALRTRFRRIIIDTPPSVPFADADAIGTFCDGILLVARAGFTRRASYLQVVESLTSAPLLGTVLNDLTYSLADHDSYLGYEKGYHEYYEKARREQLEKSK